MYKNGHLLQVARYEQVTTAAMDAGFVLDLKARAK